MPNRRDVLLGAAALAAVPGALPAQQQQAAPPPAAQPAPKFHRMTVGSLPVAIVQDGENRRPDATQLANALAEASACLRRARWG